MEKVRLDRICWLLEITKREHHHQLLLQIICLDDLQDLGTRLFPYIVYVLPRPLPNEVVKGEHFVLEDLLRSLPEGSSKANIILEPLVRPDYLPLVVYDPKPAPQAAKKKKNKKSAQVKVVNEGL